jgi:hypothetical protein
MSRLGPEPGAPRVVLASASAIRRTMLTNAGVAIDCMPAQVAEGEIKQEMRAQGAAVDAIAEALAEHKARAVSARLPDAIVIGANSMIACGDVHFDKPSDAARGVRRSPRFRKVVRSERDGRSAPTPISQERTLRCRSLLRTSMPPIFRSPVRSTLRG